MPDVVKHAWTHRPKAMGGTDPLEPIQWATLYNTQNQTITTTVELEFESWSTNSPEVFESETGDTSGLLIKVDGFYAAFGAVNVNSSDISVARGAYIQMKPQSSYPSLGDEFNYLFGLDTSLIDTTNVRITNYGFGVTFIKDFGVYRATYIATHPAGNYGVTACGLVLIRLASKATAGGVAGA